ncbi:hypothetical protein PDE_08208 [Penicillium oxalicum 114-2]|uniref:Uncharacterized protein n=1 Tax=Penicillium oxalicum (strain 114-2 / CGMCC 5302) TaxID=933388 RepID=S7ZWW4_PENO1|nr:hypothetical protein PDE_08208 [Penicillium oxalicum 114-2]
MMTTPASTDPIIRPLGEVLSILVLFFSSFFSLAHKCIRERLPFTLILARVGLFIGRVGSECISTVLVEYSASCTFQVNSSNPRPGFPPSTQSSSVEMVGARATTRDGSWRWLPLFTLALVSTPWIHFLQLTNC